jgi:hypothetical protein
MNISSLLLLVEMTNGATSCKDQSVYDEIDKVEVVADGSRVIWSVTGQEARVWSHTFLKKRPPYVRDESAAIVQSAYIFIPFGLWKYDPTHYLPPTLFTDLEIRLTVSPTIAATSFATGGNYVTIYANVWEEGTPGAFEGFLRLTQQFAFTTLASGEQQIELPIGNPYLALGIYNFESGVSPETNLSAIELDADDRRLILVEGAWNDLNQMFTHELGINPHENGVAFKSDTDVIETWVGDVAAFSMMTPQALTVGTTDSTRDYIQSMAGGAVTINSATVDEEAGAGEAANVTDKSIYWSAKAAYGLGNFLPIPFGWPKYPQNALMSNAYKRLRLTLTQGNAGAACKVSILELATRL